jgi:hypothetical protein
MIIDLPAEEVGRQPDEQAQDVTPRASPEPVQADVFGPASAADQAPTSETSGPEAADPWRPHAGDEIPQGEPAGSAAPDRPLAEAEPTDPFEPAPATRDEDQPMPPAAPARRSRAASFAALLLAALLGGAVAAGATVLLAREGYLAIADAPQGQAAPDLTAEVAELRMQVEGLSQAPPPAAAPNLAPLQAQLTELDQAVAELRNQPAAETPSGAGLEDLQNRLAAIEEAVAAGQAGGDPASEARLTELSTQIEELRAAASADGGPASAELAGRIDEIAGRLAALESRPAADVSAIEGSVAEIRQQVSDLSARLEGLAPAERVAALEASLASQEGALRETAARAEQIQVLGPAVAAGALSAAIEAGAPFAGELAALGALGVDPARLETLQPFAETGLPTLAELRAEFEEAAQSIDVSAPVPEGAGTVDRLLQSARGLVEVRRSAPTEGSDAPAVLARIRNALDAGDLRAALNEREALPEEAKAATEEWARAAEARASADEFVAELRSEALSRLGGEG